MRGWNARHLPACMHSVADATCSVPARQGKTAGKDEATDKTTYPKVRPLVSIRRPLGGDMRSLPARLPCLRPSHPEVVRSRRASPQLLGLERSKEVAQELVDEAKAALSEWGDAAAPLLGLADYIIARKN